MPSIAFATKNQFSLLFDYYGEENKYQVIKAIEKIRIIHYKRL